MVPNNKSFWHIPTDRHTVQRELQRWSHAIPETLCRCIRCEPGGTEYNKNLLVVSVILERVASLVYRCKDGKYHKPLTATYKAELFEPYAETSEEVFDLAAEFGATPETAEHIHKILWQIADLVCPMMACISEHGHVNEYAYAIDYVIRHNGNLPKPEIKLFFPTNYENYRYWEPVTKESDLFAEISL